MLNPSAGWAPLPVTRYAPGLLAVLLLGGPPSLLLDRPAAASLVIRDLIDDATLNCGGDKRFYDQCHHVLTLFAQRTVGDTGPNQATRNSLYHAPGVVVDRSSRPNKVYAIDSGNNRILGFKALGHCAAPAAQACTSDGDCPGSTCQIEPGHQADIILGQADASGGACNRDDNIGTRARPGDDTLCLTPMPLAANTAEYWRRNNADIDGEGNLYVVDVHNNRVLRFNQPLSADTSGGKGDAHADVVWGQPNMHSGDPGCSDHQLNFAVDEYEPIMAWGVSVDAHDGGVWVADTMNHRVLRFDQGTRSASAVVGQPDFTTCTAVCDRSSYQFCLPLEARPTPDGRELWVLDQNSSDGLPFSSRLVIFSQQANGWMPNRIRAPLSGYRRDASSPRIFQSTGFAFKPSGPGIADPYPGGFVWVNEHEANHTLLLNRDGGHIVTAIGGVEDPPGSGKYRRGCIDFGPCSQTFERDPRVTGDVRDYRLCWPGGSIGIDSDNNIYLASEYPAYVSRFKLPYIPIPNPNPGLLPSKCPPDPNGGVAGANVVTDAKLNQPVGVAVYNVPSDPTKQLIVQDHGRYLVWNDYPNRQDGEPADIVVAETSVGSNQLPARSYHAIDDRGRMWTSDGQGKIIVYQLPFAATGTNDPIRPACAGCSVNAADAWGMFEVALAWSDDGSDIPYWISEGNGVAFDATDPQHRAIWVSQGNRILRIGNYDRLGLEKLTVDMVLGQADKQSNDCNRNLSAPSPRTLCVPRFIAFDRLGNLYVVENTYECHGNDRVVVFTADDLRASRGQLFPQLDAKKVFGASDFTHPGQCGFASGLTAGSPITLAFDSQNHMVISNDGSTYNAGQRHLRQLWWYADPLARAANGQFVQGQSADAIIRLPLGAPGELTFDAADNLLIQDHTWSKVWLLRLDGDLDPLTGRSRWLISTACGNGVLDPGEQCDDGNAVDGDGCDANCTATACGNGIVTAGEQCDDGNAVDTDDCKSDCTLNVCGDGVLDAGVEECDDGNLISGDGCDMDCTRTACGNGIVTAGEQCDDGNAIDTDDCKSDCTLNVCGDGAIHAAAEECDDGNVVDGDGCSSQCRSELIPGGGTLAVDCRHEWLTHPMPVLSAKGLPLNHVECKEGDSTCDVGAAGDGACTFQVALCLNASEPRFTCPAGDVVSVRLQQPPQANPRAGADTANRDALEAALGGVGGSVRGQCANAARRGQLCVANSDCDATAGSGDGRCRGRFVAFTPALTTDRCTSFAAITVPLRRTGSAVARGQKTLRLKTTPSKDPITQRPRRSDRDALQLVCNP